MNAIIHIFPFLIEQNRIKIRSKISTFNYYIYFAYELNNCQNLMSYNFQYYLFKYYSLDQACLTFCARKILPSLYRLLFLFSSTILFRLLPVSLFVLYIQPGRENRLQNLSLCLFLVFSLSRSMRRQRSGNVQFASKMFDRPALNNQFCI